MYTIYGIPNCDKIKKLLKEADSKISNMNLLILRRIHHQLKR